MQLETATSVAPQARSKNVLCFCPASIGGIAQYSHEQSKALASKGISVTSLCPVDYPYEEEGYVQIRALMPKASKSRFRLLNRLKLALGIVRDISILEHNIKANDFSKVLFASYSEYLAPIWAWRLRRLRAYGTEFSAVIHDPVRDYVVGPQWWHKWSIAEGYSFLSQTFIHEAGSLSDSREELNLPVSVVPHGPFPAIESALSATEARAKYQLPPDATILMSFGYIRDNKNLHLAIQSLRHLPHCHLLIAGRASSNCQKPTSFYRDLANELGVSERCHWFNRFIPDDEVGDLFNAADLALLTYAESFRSASGVLNTAISYETPCVASSGCSSLKSVVSAYGLGKWVEPDNLDSLVAGIQEQLSDPREPEWERYLEEQSWDRNASIVLDEFLTDRFI